MKRLMKIAENKDLTKNEIFEVLIKVLNDEATVLNNNDLLEEINNEEDCKEASMHANGFKCNDCEEAALFYLNAYFDIKNISFFQRCLNKGDFNYEKYFLNEIQENNNYTVIKISDDYIFLQIG